VRGIKSKLVTSSKEDQEVLSPYSREKISLQWVLVVKKLVSDLVGWNPQFLKEGKGRVGCHDQAKWYVRVIR
jgi:hypothetical protein